MPVPSLDSSLGVLARLKHAASLVADVAYDAKRFWRHSFTQGARTRENLRARIAIGLHFLEYSMSLRASRPGHAQDKAQQLANDLQTYTKHFGFDATVEIAIEAMSAYLEFNRASGSPLDVLEKKMLGLRKVDACELRGGTELVTAEEITAQTHFDFLSFAKARHSIRQYAPGPVDLYKIARAVRAAQQSPSSCNRQTCRAWIWTQPELVARVVALQSGNRGFGDQLGGIAVITSDLADWETASERYQGWVDGGMFAMSLAYGLHAEGLGTVMLNWSVPRLQDRKLRNLTGIPDSALVITMLGFGNLPEKLRVPISQRNPLDLAMALNSPLS